MKKLILGIIAVAWVSLGVPNSQAAKVSVDVFYDALDPYGEWMEAADYGYVWRPRDVDNNWRPYTQGNWAYTDEGWTWISEEPFGWATYHYGRWANLDRTGWVWIPDTTWGPAWVSWRRSEQHVGWAPLPPEARFEARIGFSSWVDSYYDIGPDNYSFVRVRDFGSPRLRTVIVEPRENIVIIRETRNITNITYVNNVVFNNGPQYDVIVRETSQPIRRLRLDRRSDVDYRFDRNDRNRGDRFNAQVSGDSLRIVAPDIEDRRDARPARIASRIDRVDVNHGWRNAGDERQVKEFRAKIASEEKAPAELPPKALLRGPATADTQRRGNERPDASGQKPETAPPGVAKELPRGGKRSEMKPGEVQETPPAPTATTETPGARKEDRLDKPDKGNARKKGEEQPAVTATDKPDRNVPPEARTNVQPQDRPDARQEKMPKRPSAEEAKPDRAERPQADKPEKTVRPESAERPNAKADRPAPPEAVRPPAPEDRPPKRDNQPREEKPMKENRGNNEPPRPDRAEKTDRGPAPESWPNAETAPRKGADKPKSGGDKPKDGDKGNDDKKDKKDKNN